MRSYKDSDIFDIINRGNNFQNKLIASIRKISPEITLNSKASSSIDNMKRIYKETIVVKIAEAVKNHRILLICPSPEDRFNEYFPFVKAKVKGKDVVILDVSRYTSIERDENDKPISYKIDVNKLYSFIVPAYISLELLSPTTVLPSETTRYLAMIWARMFCNTLMANAMGVLQNHKERYNAFMYFAMRFFMIYYLECPMAIVENISNTYIGNYKSEYINFIETRLKDREMEEELYSSFSSFCKTILNNDISNIKGMSQKVNDMNQSEFLTIFRNQYSMNAIMGLCSVDYFINVVFNAFNKSNYVRDKGMEVIIFGKRGEYKKECPKLFDSIFKEL